jgi:anion-transporting  ArsA/GET3 family ATPase
MRTTRRSSPEPSAFDGVRLHVVSGKGGTGKTTVAAALALALASGGRTVLLCEVEGRQGIASVFDVAPLPYGERRVAVGSDGGEVVALAIDAEAALLEYLDIFYHLGRAGKALDRFGVIDFATTIAPGVRDVLQIGKVYEATRRRDEGRRDEGRPTYDAVILDAPPTGRLGRFLNVNTEVAGIAKVGPIRNQATAIMRLLKSAQTRVHLVTTLEEMPVQETLDAVAELSRIELGVGSVIINRVSDAELDGTALTDAAAGRLDDGEVEADLKEAGLRPSRAMLEGLLHVGQEHAHRVALEQDELGRLQAARLPLVSLPLLPAGVDLGALYEFAELLRESGEF